MDKEDLIELIDLLDVEKTTKLDLSNKDISEIPSNIKRLERLEYLNLSYNSIVKIPKQMCQLKNLHTLLLLRNEIEYLPETFYELERLQFIDISYNPLRELPLNFEKLVSLKHFDASYCQLRKLPLEFTELFNLKEVHLEANPFIFPPRKVISRGLYATMYYLAEQAKSRTATHVVSQIYNLPVVVQHSFKQYLEAFLVAISEENKKIFKLDINFANPEEAKNMTISKEKENQVHDLVKFVTENINTLKEGTERPTKINVFETQIHDLKSQLIEFSESIETKMLQMQNLKEKINNFAKLFEEAK